MLRSQLIVSALILLYGGSTAGIPVHFHYCKGELKHVKILFKTGCHDKSDDPEPDAGCCISTKACQDPGTNATCCSDATEWNHENEDAVPPPATDLVPALQDVRWSGAIAPAGSGLQVAHAPGEGSANSPPIYILSCALIFYG